jgi:hypothetical protein
MMEKHKSCKRVLDNINKYRGRKDGKLKYLHDFCQYGCVALAI